MTRYIAGLVTGIALAATLVGGAEFQRLTPEHPSAQATFHPESRSGQWPKVRKEHLLIEPGCAVCGKKDDVEVHHVLPFHKEPALELDPDNLITLCRDHHFFVGHLLSWKSWNVDVRKDSKAWRKKIEERPE